MIYVFIKALPGQELLPSNPDQSWKIFSLLHPFNHGVVIDEDWSHYTCTLVAASSHLIPAGLSLSARRGPAPSCLMSPSRTTSAGAGETFPWPIYSCRRLLAGTLVPLSSETLRTRAERLEFSLTAFAGIYIYIYL